MTLQGLLAFYGSFAFITSILITVDYQQADETIEPWKFLVGVVLWPLYWYAVLKELKDGF